MKIIVTLPTYNESENIRPLITELLALGPEFEVLVIDDNSPDGTFRIVGEMAAAEPRVHLLHRVNEKGRGSAGLAGFAKARDMGADAVVEMDADFSHQPKFIPSLLEPVRSREADVVIGSRLVSGGGEEGRSFLRTIITFAANFYIRTLLKLKLRDCTSGFRVFNRHALEVLPFEKMTAKGPEIVQEVLWEARAANLKMVERPILFTERRAGQSTFNSKIMLRSLKYMIGLRRR
jgi:dolichol-phosphate mannosyltransferase